MNGTHELNKQSNWLSKNSCIQHVTCPLAWHKLHSWMLKKMFVHLVTLRKNKRISVKFISFFHSLVWKSWNQSVIIIAFLFTVTCVWLTNYEIMPLLFIMKKQQTKIIYLHLSVSRQAGSWFVYTQPLWLISERTIFALGVHELCLLISSL